MNDLTSIPLRIPASLRDRLRAYATEQHRSYNQTLRLILEGVLPPPGEAARATGSFPRFGTPEFDALAEKIAAEQAANWPRTEQAAS